MPTNEQVVFESLKMMQNNTNILQMAVYTKLKKKPIIFLKGPAVQWYFNL